MPLLRSLVLITCRGLQTLRSYGAYALCQALAASQRLSRALRRATGYVIRPDGHFGRDLVFGLRHAEQPVVEPADDVLQALDAVPGLAGARKLVRLAGEAHHHGRNFAELQGAEHLLAARARRRAVVRLAQ